MFILRINILWLLKAFRAPEPFVKQQNVAVPDKVQSLERLSIRAGGRQITELGLLHDFCSVCIRETNGPLAAQC